ncbi:solute carrier family 26 member 6 [Microcaecilia unicolor]|uniref:Solute carrier family 26 member 6-like n=1 Tax=Microcaecilia unicolor TaxID=1415580 RepID=A0A6P7YF41_9AMPH|nr:solute carrier family 26 member 6-like [Microcaecilia unicolor]
MKEKTELQEWQDSHRAKLSTLSEAELEKIAPNSQNSELSFWSQVRRKVSIGQPAPKSLLQKMFPVLRWLPHYPTREWLVGDLISGLSVGIVQLPQGLAYSMLAGLPPVFGLYTSFYPVFVYFLFGTSRHISVGTFAVICVMIGSVTESLAPNQDFILPGNGTLLDTAARNKARVELASALTFLVGLFQCFLGLVKFGFVVTYLSDPLVSGYTTASAIHVTVSQLKNIFGFQISQKTQPLSLIYTLRTIFTSLPETNIGTLITSIISLAALFVVKFMNEKFCSKFLMPIPIELIMLIISTGISYGLSLQEKFGIEIVGEIPVGFRLPVVPETSLFGKLVGHSFAIAVVGYAITISLGKLFAVKHGYKVDSNQELVALGLSNFVGSFFQCFAISSSVSRSLVQESTGGNSQVASAVSCCIIFIILLRAGELFQDLPRAVLAAVVVVNLKGIFKQFGDIFVLWRCNRTDLLIWLVTFTATLLLNMDMGLIVSIMFALFTVIFRTQISHYSTLGQIPGTDIYRDVAKYKQAKELAGVKIFHSSTTVYFANAELYAEALKRKCGFDIDKLIEKKKKAIKRQKRMQKKARMQAKDVEAGQMTGYDNSGFVDTETETSSRTMTQTGWTIQVFICRHLLCYLPEKEHPEITPVPNPQYTAGILLGMQEERGFAAVISETVTCPETQAKAMQETTSEEPTLDSLGLEKPNFHSLILDFASINFVDTVCIKVLKNIFRDFREIEVNVYLVGCHASIINQLERGNFFSKTITKDQLFVSVHDAITYLSKEYNQKIVQDTMVLSDTRL